MSMINVARLKGQPSVRDRVSAAEWEARVELAAAHRYAEYSNWTDLIFNHFTLRVPGEPNHFLVKQHELMFEEVTASSLLKISMDGKPVGTDEHVNAAAYTIHTAIFEARPTLPPSRISTARRAWCSPRMRMAALSLPGRDDVLQPRRLP